MKEFTRLEDKRKYPRFHMSIPVEYKMLKSSPENRKGSVVSDISAGGVKFICDEFLALTARMVLDIALPIPDRPISAVSKVAWIRKLPNGDRYEIGNQFLEMSKDDKERLANCLNRMAIAI